MICRYCESSNLQTVLDLGFAPISNRFPVDIEEADASPLFPLFLVLCMDCSLVQSGTSIDPGLIFHPGYPYLSGYSRDWKAHCHEFAVAASSRLCLDSNSLVLEVACSDGTLLSEFQKLGVRTAGVEPSPIAATVARDRGLEIFEDFFDEEIVDVIHDKVGHPDLIVANNVVAHVPYIRPFLESLAACLTSEGSITVEIPSLASLIKHRQFDTVYLEHYSYLSFTFLNRAMHDSGLYVYDIEHLPTHGGSYRVWAHRKAAHASEVSGAVQRTLAMETDVKVTRPESFAPVQESASALKNEVRSFLESARDRNELVVGYGAAAKAATLLTFAAVGPELLPFIVDQNPHKIGRYLPGTRIPVDPPVSVRTSHPASIVIFPWNWSREIARFLRQEMDFNGGLVAARPGLPRVDTQCES